MMNILNLKSKIINERVEIFKISPKYSRIEYCDETICEQLHRLPKFGENKLSVVDLFGRCHLSKTILLLKFIYIRHEIVWAFYE